MINTTITITKHHPGSNKPLDSFSWLYNWESLCLPTYLTRCTVKATVLPRSIQLKAKQHMHTHTHTLHKHSPTYIVVTVNTHYAVQVNICDTVNF